MTKKGKFSNVAVHESVKLVGKTSKFKHYMIHLAYDNVDEFIHKQKMYSRLSKKKKNILKALFSPCWVLSHVSSPFAFHLGDHRLDPGGAFAFQSRERRRSKGIASIRV